MRKDFPKILVERPRRGVSFAKKLNYRALPKGSDEESQPVHESMRARANATRERKMLNENLSPLYRFLQKRVGQRWDRVYAEIAERNPRNSAVGAHIYQHLDHMVETTPLLIDGRPTPPSAWIRWGPDTLWVDDTGILRRLGGPTQRQRDRAKKAAEPPEFIKMDDTHVAKRDEHGNWFKVTVLGMEAAHAQYGRKDISGNKYVVDVWTHKQWRMADGEATKLYGVKDGVAVAKRAMNKREIARMMKED